jgi:hypothetical protein
MRAMVIEDIESTCHLEDNEPLETDIYALKQDKVLKCQFIDGPIWKWISAREF